MAPNFYAGHMASFGLEEWWVRRRTVLIILAAMLVLASCSSESGGDEVQTADATGLVEEILLTDGEVHLTVQAAEQAYSKTAEATAVAAMVSITGADSLCMFWYMEGIDPDDGLIIGDAYARQFSPWGASVTTGSPEDEMVMNLRSSPEGTAVLAAIDCGPYL